MLSEEKKDEIRKLRAQGLNISEIARRTSVDWKTVRKILAQSKDRRKEEDPDKDPGKNDSQDEGELSKVVFKKLNSGESPEEIIAEIGHVDLVIDCHNKWKTLRGHASKNLSPPDPKIFRSLYAWVDSVDEYSEWHRKMAQKSLAGFAWLRMGGCANYKKQAVECMQLKENNPYACLACDTYSPSNVFTSELDF
jgi:transposase-like protein